MLIWKINYPLRTLFTNPTTEANNNINNNSNNNNNNNNININNNNKNSEVLLAKGFYKAVFI